MHCLPSRGQGVVSAAEARAARPVAFAPMPSAKQPSLRAPACMPSLCNCKTSTFPTTDLISLPLPPQGWVVDVREIQLLRAASGDPMELGSGATATVYKAKLRGETVAAKEMDLGRR